MSTTSTLEHPEDEATYPCFREVFETDTNHQQKLDEAVAAILNGWQILSVKYTPLKTSTSIAKLIKGVKKGLREDIEFLSYGSQHSADAFGVVYCTQPPGYFMFTVVPLPLGRAVLTSHVPSRQSPNSVSMADNIFFKRLGAIPWQLIDPTATTPEITINVSRDCTFSAGYVPPLKGGTHEAEWYENKRLRKAKAFAGDVKPMVLQYFHEELLNAGSHVILNIGVDDSTGKWIGMQLEENCSEEKLSTMVKIALKPIFPRIPASAVTIYIHELLGSSPEDWDHFFFREIVGLPSDEKKLQEELADLLLQYSGRASVVQHESVWYLLVPDKIEALNWMEVPNLAVWDKTLPKRRCVISVHAKLPIEFQQAFYSCHKDHIRRVKAPIVDESMNKRYLSTIGLWIRVASAQPFSPRLSTILSSDSYVHIMFCDGAIAEELALNTLRQALPIGSFSNPQIYTTAPSKRPDYLKFRRTAPRALVTTIEATAEAANFIARDFSGAQYTVVILVPCSWLTEAKSVELQSNIIRLGKPVVVEDIRVVFDRARPVVTSHGIPPSNVFQKLVDTSYFQRVQLSANPPDTQQGRDWLMRRTRDQPVSWDLIHYQFAVLTTQVKHIRDATSTILVGLEEGTMREVNVAKILAGSGATTTARIVAYELRETAFVLWVEKDPTEESICEVCRTAYEYGKPLLLFADEHIEHSQLRESLSKATVAYRARACLFSINARLHRETVSSLPIVPFLGPNDVYLLSSALAKALGDDDATTALDAAAKEATIPGAANHSRHLFVFCLAAAKGKFEPALSWITRIYTEIAKNHDVLNVAITLAVASSFCPGKSQCLPKLIFKRVKSALPDQFWELFEEIPSRLIVCIHPFLARLFLWKAKQVQWTSQWIPLDQLNACWEVVTTCLQDNLWKELLPHAYRQLLCDRPHKEDFSRIISQVLHQTEFKSHLGYRNVPDRPQQLEHFLTKLLPECHYYVVYARIYRHRAKMLYRAGSDQSSYLLGSVECAKAALDAAKNSDWANMTLHVAVVMYGGAGRFLGKMLGQPDLPSASNREQYQKQAKAHYKTLLQQTKDENHKKVLQDTLAKYVSIPDKKNTKEPTQSNNAGLDSSFWWTSLGREEDLFAFGWMRDLC